MLTMATGEAPGSVVTGGPEDRARRPEQEEMKCSIPWQTASPGEMLRHGGSHTPGSQCSSAVQDQVALDEAFTPLRLSFLLCKTEPIRTSLPCYVDSYMGPWMGGRGS